MVLGWVLVLFPVVCFLVFLEEFLEEVGGIQVKPLAALIGIYLLCTAVCLFEENRLVLRVDTV